MYTSTIYPAYPMCFSPMLTEEAVKVLHLRALRLRSTAQRDLTRLGRTWDLKSGEESW